MELEEKSRVTIPTPGQLRPEPEPPRNTPQGPSLEEDEPENCRIRKQMEQCDWVQAMRNLLRDDDSEPDLTSNAINSSPEEDGPNLVRITTADRQRRLERFDANNRVVNFERSNVTTRRARSRPEERNPWDQAEVVMETIDEEAVSIPAINPAKRDRAAAEFTTTAEELSNALNYALIDVATLQENSGEQEDHNVHSEAVAAGPGIFTEEREYSRWELRRISLQASPSLRRPAAKKSKNKS